MFAANEDINKQHLNYQGRTTYGSTSYNKRTHYL